MIKKTFLAPHQFSFPGDHCGGDRGAVHGGIHTVREDAEYCGILVSADHDGSMEPTYGVDTMIVVKKNGAIRD